MADVHARVTVLEVEMIHLKQEVSEIRSALRDIQATVWKAAGALGLVVFLAPYAAKYFLHL